MSYKDDNGKLDATRALSQILQTSRRRTSNFEFDDNTEAGALLMEFYRRELHRDELNPERLAYYCDQVIGYLTNSKRFLLMYGTTGCGKTTMLNAICKMIGYLYYSNISGTGTALDRRGFQWENAYTITEWAKNDRSRYEDFKRCEWAAIDDIGQEAAEVSNYGAIIYPVRDILLYRYENDLVTILTTNKAPKDLTDFYGPRVGDRLAEVTQMIKFIETSYRRL